MEITISAGGKTAAKTISDEKIPSIATALGVEESAVAGGMIVTMWNLFLEHWEQQLKHQGFRAVIEEVKLQIEEEKET